MPGNNLGTASGRIKVDTSDLKNADISLRSAGRGMLIFGAAAVAGFAAVVNTAAKYEKEMDFVQAVTQASGEEMDALSKKAIDLAKNSVFGPIELAKSFVDLAKAGATTQEIIDGVGEAAVNLAQAADVPIPFAGESLLNILNTFKLGAKDAVHVTDLMAGAANASSIELTDMVESMQYAGPVAAAMGISIEDLGAAITLLGKVGIRGSIAGTSLRMMMSRLTSPTAAAEKALTSVGLSVEDGVVKQFTRADGSLKGLAEIMEILRVATKDLSGQAKVAFAGDVFGIRAMPSVIELMSQGTKGFAEINQEIGRTTAMDVAAKRTDNLTGAIARLKAMIQVIFVGAGGPFQNMLKGWVEGITNLLKGFDSLPGPIKTFLVGALGVVGIGSLMAGAFLLTIGNMVRMIRVMGQLRTSFVAIRASMMGTAFANNVLSVSFLTSPVFLIAAAIIALGVAFYLLYTRVEGFRKFIDGVWQEMQILWDKIIAFAKDLPDIFRRLWAQLKENASAAWNGIFAGFEGIFNRVFGILQRIPGQIAGFFTSIAGSVAGFATDVAGKIADIFTGVVGSIGRFFETIGRFFTRLPGIIAGGLSTAAGAVVDFLSGLPELIGYWGAFIIGRYLRIFYYEIPKAIFLGGKRAVIEVYKFGKGIVLAVGRFFGRLPGIISRWLAMAFGTLVRWGTSFVLKVVEIGARFGKAVVDFISKIPGAIGRFLTSIITTITNKIPEFTGAAWRVGSSVIDTIWNFFTRLPGIVWDAFTTAVSYVWGKLGEFTAAAEQIGMNVTNAIIDFFSALPGKIWQWLTDAATTIGNFASTFYQKAQSIASSLWHGFWDGISGSPHTKIEYAMWNMTDNMSKSIDEVKRHIGTIQGLQNTIPQLNAGVLGLPSAADVAVTSNGGGQIWQQNAPLVGQAVIRDDRDIVTLARQLDSERKRQQRARGVPA